MRKRLGGYTEIIDPKPFFTDYNTIGIKNVNILNQEGNDFIANQQIILRNGVIQSIDSINVLDKSITYIDGKGKYLIPSLTDTHVHLKHSKNDLYLYLANGVTTVWEMFGSDIHLEWRAEQQNGAISPKLFVASQKLNSQEGLLQWLRKYAWWDINITSVNDVRPWIQKIKSKGFDAIKIGSYLNKQIFDAILKEAKSENMIVMGHLPLEISFEEIYASGISELAHIEEIARRMENDFGGLTYNNFDEYIAYMQKHADSVAIRLRENNIAVSTTIWLMESVPSQKFDTENFIKTIEIEYANPTISEGKILSFLMFKGWFPNHNEYEDLETLNDPEWREDYINLVNTWLKGIQIVTKALHKNGTTILAGTDANATGVVAGFSLHDELQTLVENGFTNAEALYTATISPANWANKTNGIIQQGFDADLLLLNKNPLEDIKNTKSIEMVFFNSFYLEKESRAKLLTEIKKSNDKIRTIDISMWK